jgi:hypothetical protein
MDWLNLFASWIAAQLQAWIQATLASGHAGTPVQNLPVSAGATPELDSLVLFGAGLLGAGGYALTRFRARRRHGEHVGSSTR